MSFEIFVPLASGRKGIGDGISLSRVQINFGKKKPPFDYLSIEYDKENLAIRFSKGTRESGYKVHLNKNSYFLNAYSFIKKGLLPIGRYALVKDWTFQKAAPLKDKEE